MSQSIQLQVTQVGLEQSIAAAMKRVGSSSQINLGTNSKQINALSQPLGRITGQADEFSKSMAAANARVLAFGASAGIIAGVSKAMSGLLTSTIKVEKSLVEISTVLNKTGSELDKFGQDIFNVAKNTGKSFDEVAKGALELARQGLNAEDTLARLNDALILSRLSGLDAAQSVEGLTAAFNSFKSSGITTAEILNKVVAAAQKYSVSERDIIEGLKRSASVANLAGVSFEELAAVITAVQEKTARGGAVIGNAFKTIFSRIQDKAVLSDLQDMRVGVTDLQGEVLPALKILENLAKKMGSFSQIEQADIAKKLGGVYQLDKLLAALNDLSDEASVTTGALKAMGEAGSKAYQKNAVLNQTLAALLNKVAVSAEQLGAKLGEIGVTDSLKNVLGFFNGLLEGIQKVLGEESGLGNLVRGLVKGLGAFLAGPGLALFGAIILKLSKDLVQFGFASLKAFFGIGKAAKEVQNVEGSISQILAKNVNLQQQLFALEGNRAAQLRLITGALVEQEALLRRSANISSGLAAPLYNVGGRAKDSGLRIGNSAGGYMPAVAKESKAIKQGVGGARSGDRPVVMPNFNFGGGKKGTMVAHTGEYVVPNFNGSGGTAVFNRRMVQSMGLPRGAKKINAAGGLVPNFANTIKPEIIETPFTTVDSFKKSKSGALRNGENADLSDQFKAIISVFRQKKAIKSYQNEAGLVLGKGQSKTRKEDDYIFTKLGVSSGKKINEDALERYKKEWLEAGADPSAVSSIETSIRNIKYAKGDTKGNKDKWIKLQNKVQGVIGEIDASQLLGKPILGKNSFFDLTDNNEVKTTERQNLFEIVKKYANSFLSNNYIKNPFDENVSGKLGLVVPYDTKLNNSSYFEQRTSQRASERKINSIIDNSAGGFIPNFAEAPRPKAIDDEIRKYVEAGNIENYIRPGKDEFGRPYRSYWFPDGTQAAPSQVERVMKSSRAVSAVNADIKQAKIADKGSYELNAQNLGGIALISPRFGKKKGLLNTTMKIADIPFFNYKDAPPIDKNKYIQLSGIQKTNTPSGRDIEGVEEDISDTFAQGIVDLAYKLYGKLFAQNEDWVGTIRKIAKTPGQQLLPTAAQGDLFEAAGKVAVNSLRDAVDLKTGNLKSTGIFSGKEQNRPFDFSNAEGISKIFGITAERGEAKRGGEANFESSGQVQGIIKKVFNDPEYSARALKILKAKGAFNLSEAQKAVQAKNAFGGFIPNFANPLQDAVNREMSAGIPASQIYVDKSPTLKNAANPMGLMVANRRDEPAGGFQGINRAIKEGADPMTYGAADGFVPNYVAAIPPQYQSIAYGRKPTTAPDALSGYIPGLNKRISNVTGKKSKTATDPKSRSYASYSLKQLDASLYDPLSYDPKSTGSKLKNYINIDYIRSLQKGDGLRMFNHLGALSKRSGMKLYSTILLAQDKTRLDDLEANLQGGQRVGFEEILKGMYPQLWYRKNSNVKNTNIDSFSYRGKNGREINAKRVSGKDVFSLLINEIKGLHNKTQSGPKEFIEDLRGGSLSIGISSIVDTFARGYIPNAAGGFVPNFGVMDAFNAAKFAISSSKNLGSQLPQGVISSALKGKLDLDKVWPMVSKFVEEPERLIKTRKDLDNAKYTIKTFLTNDKLREKFAKFAAQRINTAFYNNKNVISGTRESGGGEGHSIDADSEEYLKYKLLGGQKSLKDYDGKKSDAYIQKGEFLKLNPKSEHGKQVATEAALAGRRGYADDHGQDKARMTDHKGGFYGNTALLGGFTGKQKLVMRKNEFPQAYASYKDSWDVALHPAEKEILYKYLDGQLRPSASEFSKIIQSQNAYVESEQRGFNIGPYILRELVSSIPKAKPAVFKGVVPFNTRAAGGFIPNFAGGTPNRASENAKRLLEKLKPLTGIAKTLGFDQFLGAVLPNGISPIEQDLVGKSLEQVIPAAKAGFQDLMNRGIGVSVSTREMGAFQSILKDLIDLDAGIPLRSGSHINDPTPMIQGLVKRARIAHKQIKEQARRNIEGGAAGGFLPNFANPLQAAVGREMAAGVPASQIYIDKSPALKNAANPMGLMVANRRDEPAGGFQGINRARREGANPMMYGAAGGFVPNYASLTKAVSKETGIKINPGAAQQAIDEFAKDSLKAGADMKKLSQALERKLKAITQEDVISGQLAKAAKDEIIKRQEVIANKALESTAGKKVSSKLDKILQEYNKSEKTEKDLEKAKAKAAAALNKTALNEIKKSAIVSSVGSLAAARKGANAGAGGNRDMLGTIFALQGAMSALTGSTEGATSEFAKITNAFASVASTATTVVFATQGLSQLFGGAATAAGKLASSFGTLATVGIVAYSAWKEYAKYQDSNNIYITKAGEAAARLAESANKAATNLGNINPGLKTQINKETEASFKRIGYKAQAEKVPGGTTSTGAVVDQVMGPLVQAADYLVGGVKNPSNPREAVSREDIQKTRITDIFGGLGADLKNQITESVNQARGVGIPQLAVDSIIEKYALQGELNKLGEIQIAAKDGESVINDLNRLMSQMNLSSPESILAKFSNEEVKAFGSVGFDDNNLAMALAKNLLNEVAKAKSAQGISAEERDQRVSVAQMKYEGFRTPASDMYAKILDPLLKKGTDPRIAAEIAGKVQGLAASRNRQNVEENDTEIARSPRELEETIKAIKREKLERESIRTIEQQIADKRYDSSLLVAGIEADLNLSASNRTIKTLEAQAALEKQTAELEAQKTIQEELNKLAGEFMDKGLFKGSNAEDKVRATLKNLKDNKEAQAILSSNNQQQAAIDFAKAQLQGTDLKENIYAAEQLAKAILNALDLQERTNRAVQDGNDEKEKSKNLEIAKNKIQEQNNKASERYAQLMSARATDISNQSTQVGYASQLKNADIDVKLAQLSKTNGISPFERRDEENRLERLKFQNELQSERERNILDAKAEFVRNAKLEENILALGDNNEQIKENTIALKKLVEVIPNNPLASNFRLGPVGSATDRMSKAGGAKPSFMKEFGNPTGRTSSIADYRPATDTGLATTTVLTTKVSEEEKFKKAEELSKLTDSAEIYNSALKYATEELTLQDEAAASLAQKLAQAANTIRSGEDAAKAKEDLREREDAIKQINGEIQSIGQSENSQLQRQLDDLKGSPSTFAEGMQNAFLQMQIDGEQFAYLLGKDIPKMFSDGISGAINSAIEGTVSLKEGFRSAAYELVKTINQRMTSRLVDRIVSGKPKGKGEEAAGGGGFIDFLSGMLGFASGGKVTGGSGSKDDVPAMLMGGEYVVNKKAVSKYGPKFLEAINNGTLNGYANGGMVDSEKNPYNKLIQNIYEERRSKAKKIQGGNAGFYTPGTYNTGAILGKRDLLSFATQSGTSGVFDRMTNENGYQSIALEPESPMLSVSGMRNSPQFEATQSAKQQAFDLYLQQYNAEIEAKKQEKEKKKALTSQLLMLVGSAALGGIGNAASSGAKAALGNLPKDAGFFQKFGTAFSGAIKGGKVGNQQVGGLSNLFSGAGKMFSGDFAGAVNKFKLSQIGNAKQLSDLYQSDQNFASYIDKSGGIGALRAEPVSGAMPFSANASIPRGTARTPAGVVFDAATSMSGGNLFPEGLSDPNMTPLVENPEFILLPRKPKGSATGGMIPSRSGIDTVPAMLSGGEFVMNRSAVQSIGAPNLQSMNSGGTSITSEETSKELNEKLLAKLDELIGASGSTGNITINVAPSGQTSQETSQDPSASRQQLARQIKDAVLQIINDEKRIGGSLRR
jgi:TP901 family phage tail tape measure protein